MGTEIMAKPSGTMDWVSQKPRAPARTTSGGTRKYKVSLK